MEEDNHTAGNDWEFWLETFVTNAGRVAGKPFKWDRKSNKLKIIRPCWSYRFGLLVLTCDCMYQTFVAVTLNYSQTSMKEIMTFLLHSISRMACVIVEISLIPTQMASDHFNEIITVHRQLKEKHKKNIHYQVGSMSIRRFYMLVAILSVLQPLTGPIPQFLKERHNFRYWGSVYLPRYIYDTPLVIWLFVILELLSSNISATTVAYAGLILHLYTFLTGSWIDFFRNNLRYEIQKLKGRMLGTNKLIPTKTIKSVMSNLTGYRLLAIQNRLHNDSFSPFLWPIFQYVILVLHCLLNFILVRSQRLNLPSYYYVMLSCVTFVVLFFEKNCFETAANIYDSSIKYRNELGKLQNKLFSKVKASLRPLRIEVGSCYYFKTSTFITYERSLVDYTINTLLTIK